MAEGGRAADRSGAGAPPSALARKSASSSVERAKRENRRLRGGWREALSDGDAGLGEADRQVAKFHGIYQQEDRDTRSLARELREAMTPATYAYHEVRLDGHCVDSSHESEPIYGEAYLPRKFKTGLALPEDNSPNVHDQDVCLIGTHEQGDGRWLYGIYVENGRVIDDARRRGPKEGLGDSHERCLRGEGRRDILTGAKNAPPKGSPSPAKATS